jgi:pimeloyl-ACP methyl ester carboxylesterase
MRAASEVFYRDRIVTMANGQRIETRRTGHDKDPAVILLHGSPGHMSGPIPRPLEFIKLGVQAITYSRPGYGESDRREGRRVADEAEHIKAIADSYKLDEFSVIGRSGGGPGALAAAALLPERVRSVGALVSPAPDETLSADWTEGMTNHNSQTHQNAIKDPEAVRVDLTHIAEQIQMDPRYLLKKLRPDLNDHDNRILDFSPVEELTLQAYRYGLTHGAGGWIDDTLALHRPPEQGGWGFDLSTITAPTIIWQGESDPFVPLKHGAQLESQIPNSHRVIMPGRSHFSALEVFTRVVAWCRDNQ